MTPAANLWRRFLRAVTPLQQITLVDVPTDKQRVAQLDDMAKTAREHMGRAWICHRANWITTPAQRKRQQATAAAVHRLTGRAPSVVSIRKRK